MPPPVKRQASDSFGGNGALVKRQKSSSDLHNDQALVVGRGSGRQSEGLVPSVSRLTSSQVEPDAKYPGQGRLICYE